MPEVGYDTILEGDLPERSANYTSLAAFGAKTQGDWEDEIWGAEENRWGINGLLGALFDGLEQGVSFVTAVIGGIFEAVFEGVSFVATTIGDALTALGSAFGIKFGQIDDAQSSAAFANSQTAVITTSSFATSVAGGVAVTADFNEASANTLTGFTRVLSDGPGAGFFGPDGNGRAVWKKSGGSDRRHIDRFNTPLSTDTQAVLTVMLTPVQDPLLGGDAYTYLIGRMNSAGSAFVYARIGNNDLVVGKYVSGTFTDFTTPVSISSNDGDLWMFLLGTSANARQFVVKQNGLTRFTHTDTTGSSLGASYRYVGVGAAAASRALLDQTVPGVLELWTASDRLASGVDLADFADMFDGYQLSAQKGQANGYAGLDSEGLVPVSQLPDRPYDGPAWFYGSGAPGTIVGSKAGDFYLDVSTGDIYVLGG